MVALRFATLLSVASSAAAWGIPAFSGHSNAGFGAGGFGAGSYPGAGAGGPPQGGPPQGQPPAGAQAWGPPSAAPPAQAQGPVVGTNPEQASQGGMGGQGWGGQSWNNAPSQASWGNRMSQNWTNGERARPATCPTFIMKLICPKQA